VVLLGRPGAEPIAAAAAAMAGPDDLTELRLADDQFRFDGITSYRDPNFVPGAVKYGDLPGLLTLVAPTPVRIEAK